MCSFIENKKYEVDAVLFAKINKEESTFNVLQSNIVMKLIKEDKEAEFWPRLLSDKLKEKTNVKVDWDKYVDEDEADGVDFDADDMGGMGMPGNSTSSSSTTCHIFNSSTRYY